MPKVQLNQLSLRDKCRLLVELERIGKNNLRSDLYNSLLYNLPSNLLENKEFLVRYLLLAAILDQQAESDSARKTVIEIYRTYGSSFFMNPWNYISNFNSVMNLAIKVYQPRTRVLRIKKEGIILWRIGGFILALIDIIQCYGLLTNYLSSFKTPHDMLDGILNNTFFKGLLYEKAARMYVGWISHPNLFVDISNGAWPPSSIPMVINGHVCKVFARTGFLSSVRVEYRKNIVEAERERTAIEKEVKRLYPNGDYFAIDYGAFYVGINYCKEVNPQCNKCPINNLCKKNIQVRAY